MNNIIEYYSSKVDAFTVSSHESGRYYPKELGEIVHRLEERAIFEKVQLSTRLRALDIGAGGGRWSLAMVEKVGTLCSIEPSNLCAVLKSRLGPFPNAEVSNMSLQDFSAPQKFDVVMVSGVLLFIHPESFQAAFTKIVNLTEEGGYLIVREPIRRSPCFIVNGRRQSNLSQDDAQSARYFEVIRAKSELLECFRHFGLGIVASFPSHSPLLYQPMFRNALLSGIQARLHAWMVRADHIDGLHLYNHLTGRMFGLISHVLNLRTMTIFILRKEPTSAAK